MNLKLKENIVVEGNAKKTTFNLIIAIVQIWAIGTFVGCTVAIAVRFSWGQEYLSLRKCIEYSLVSLVLSISGNLGRVYDEKKKHKFIFPMQYLLPMTVMVCFIAYLFLYVLIIRRA